MVREGSPGPYPMVTLDMERRAHGRSAPALTCRTSTLAKEPIKHVAFPHINNSLHAGLSDVSVNNASSIPGVVFWAEM